MYSSISNEVPEVQYVRALQQVPIIREVYLYVKEMRS